MAMLKKCPKCGVDVTDPAATTCPMCGTALFTLPSPSPRIWIGALVQIGIMTAFMLVFRFPKFMIVPMVVFILLGTALSALLKSRAVAERQRASQQPLAHPALFRIIVAAIALCGFVLLSSVLFGFVIFMNSWNQWHQYEGQPFHHGEFQVTQAYFQRGSKGAVDAYARGMVEGRQEWMNLRPYLTSVPRSQQQLDEMAGPGTTIPVFLFPELKGRARVRVDNGVHPADAGRRDAMNALKFGSIGLALSAILIFFLNRVRQACYVPTDSPLQFGASAGS